MLVLDGRLMAGGPGFEPGLAESESAVLPLDDPPVESVEAFCYEKMGL